MKWYTLIKKVKGLPYKIGQKVPLYIGNKNQLLWHVWKTIITVPRENVKRCP